MIHRKRRRVHQAAEGRVYLAPPAWSDSIGELYARQASPYLEAYARHLREEDAQLRTAHPWRWRWTRVRRLAWRTYYAAARYWPIRWVGFGHEWQLDR